jgi:hypothetical protein
VLHFDITDYMILHFVTYKSDYISLNQVIRDFMFL